MVTVSVPSMRDAHATPEFTRRATGMEVYREERGASPYRSRNRLYYLGRGAPLPRDT